MSRLEENSPAEEDINDDDDEDSRSSGSTDSDDDDDSNKQSSSGQTEEDESSEEWSDETDSDDSVWNSLDGADGETQEANEAVALQEFQDGLEELVAGNGHKATKIFYKLLANPLVSVHHQDVFDWDAESDDRLSKMKRLFVGLHKNLAALEEDKSIDHYLQVVAVAPDNPQVWKEIGMKCVQKGDLEFALYAFRRSRLADSSEHIAVVMYLSKQYFACLEYIKRMMEHGTITDKAIFLKEQIRNKGDAYREFSDSIFNENRRYEVVSQLPAGVTKEYSVRLSALEELQSKMTVESSVNYMDPPKPPIEIDISEDYNFEHFCTILCDVFDRIESYSSSASQDIVFSSWEDRTIILDVREAVDQLLDIIDITEEMTKRASRIAELSADIRSRSVSQITDADYKNIRRSARLPLLEVERDRYSPNPYNSTEDVERPQTMTSLIKERPPRPHSNNLASYLQLQRGFVDTLRECSISQRPTRTPTPHNVEHQLDEEKLFSRLRLRLINGTWKIRIIIELVLTELANASPRDGILAPSLHIVVIQLYRRLNRMRSNMEESEWIRLHLLMDEIGDPLARDYCIRWQFGHRWPDRECGLRFAWNHVKNITDDSIRLDFLHILESSLSEDELVSTGKGYFCRTDVDLFIGRVAKKERIRSIKEHRAADNHSMVVSIIESDIDLCSLDENEVICMVEYWMDSLVALKESNKAIELINRILDHSMNMDVTTVTEVDRILNWLKVLLADEESFGDVDHSALCTTAHFLCNLTATFLSHWPLWRMLHSIILVVDGPVTAEKLMSWIEVADPDEDDRMPSKSLDVLMKAHEALGGAKLCSQQEGEFLVLYMNELSVLYSDPQLRPFATAREPAWLWANVQQEVAQCFYCAFGRYCKKKKPQDDHECKNEVKPSIDLALTVIPLAMPHPLPLFDDKERLGHDVVDLIQGKFDFLLNVSEHRREHGVEFMKWLRTVDYQQYSEDERIQWPEMADDSELQSSVWYVMALHSYRQNNHSDTIRYARLFLTSRRSSYFDDQITVSAWAMMSHASACELFQLDEDDLLKEYRWSTMTFRVGLSVCKNTAVMHFQLANSLYQVATKLSRFIDELPVDDFRRRRLPSLQQMRHDSEKHFEAALSLAQPTPTSPIEEFQWLCYFFLAKLHAKHDDPDILKVVDLLFEAACSLELGDFFYYTIKISAKKQQNIEPVELHYHLHSVVWKYISRTEDPPINTLITLLSYVRAFQSHKVVRNNFSLFTRHPEIYEATIKMTVETAEQIDYKDDKGQVVPYCALQDIRNELYDLCYKGFELICERFPHLKAHYRLAQMDLAIGKTNKAADHLLRGVFKRKKKEDGFLDGVIEITSTDIDRCGSFVFHVERSFRLIVALLKKQKDAATLLHATTAVVAVVASKDEDRFALCIHRSILALCVRALREVLTDANAVRHAKAEIVRLWQAIAKYPSCLELLHLRESLRTVLEPNLGPLDNFMAAQSGEVKKRQIRKRKLTSFDLGVGQPSPQPVNSDTPPPTAQGLPQQAPLMIMPAHDPDIQIMEDPLFLVRMAMQAAGFGGMPQGL